MEGWVHDIRDIGGLKFIQVRDGCVVTQVTVSKDKSPEEVQQAAKHLSPETVIRVEGSLQDNPKAPGGKELIPTSLEVIAPASPLPITVTEKTITTGQSKRLDWRSIDLRKPRLQAIFRIQSKLLQGMQEHLWKHGFQQVFTPCLLGVASEGGSEVFPIIYFDREAFLRQDPQLHRQLTLAGGMKKIFDIGPAWRAEQSHTNRHLCEHRVCAVESSFIKDEHDTMRIEEGIIIAALQKVADECQQELKQLGTTLVVPKSPFPSYSMPEVRDILAGKGKPLGDAEDLDTEAERLLWEHVKQTTGSEFYFVYKFPFAIKPFYVMRIDEEPEYARSVDLYFKGLELSSGGQREHRKEKLMEAVKEKKLAPEEVEWFTKFFDLGIPPHGGFAIGIERLTQSLLDIENIRDCVLFPRDPERLVP